MVITRDQIGFRAEWSRKRVIPKEHLLVTISFALTLFRNVVSTLRYKSRSRASSRPRLNKNDIYLAGNCPFNLTNQKKKKKKTEPINFLVSHERPKPGLTEKDLLHGHVSR